MPQTGERTAGGDEPLPRVDVPTTADVVYLFICQDCGRRFADPPAPVTGCGCGGDTYGHTYPPAVYERLERASRTLTNPCEDDDRVVVSFDQDLLLDVLEGEKTMTVRVDWEHDLEPGDPLVLVDAPTRTPFDTATALSQGAIPAGAFVDGRFSGHQTYADLDELQDALAAYYPETTIGSHTRLDAVWFQPHAVGVDTTRGEWGVA